MAKKTLKGLMEEYGKLRANKAKHEDAIKELNEAIADIEVVLLAEMEAEDIQAHKLRDGAQIIYTEREVPTIVDWPKFITYAKRKGNDDLLQRRISTSAWRERLLDNKQVPGVASFTKRGLQYRKPKRKL